MTYGFGGSGGDPTFAAYAAAAFNSGPAHSSHTKTGNFLENLADSYMTKKDPLPQYGSLTSRMDATRSYQQQPNYVAPKTIVQPKFQSRLYN